MNQMLIIEIDILSKVIPNAYYAQEKLVVNERYYLAMLIESITKHLILRRV